jgi:hypothetical protein
MVAVAMVAMIMVVPGAMAVLHVAAGQVVMALHFYGALQLVFNWTGRRAFRGIK